MRSPQIAQLGRVCTHKQREKECGFRCGFRVCVMASIIATTNLTYQVGDDRLLGIKKLPEKCREHVMDVLEQSKWKPPKLILTF
jgi:hypothetical protein